MKCLIRYLLGWLTLYGLRLLMYAVGASGAWLVASLCLLLALYALHLQVIYDCLLCITQAYGMLHIPLGSLPATLILTCYRMHGMGRRGGRIFCMSALGSQTYT